MMMMIMTDAYRLTFTYVSLYLLRVDAALDISPHVGGQHVLDHLPILVVGHHRTPVSSRTSRIPGMKRLVARQRHSTAVHPSPADTCSVSM